MEAEPNERLVFEAARKRIAFQNTPAKEGYATLTEKGKRELSALFALQDSIRRGEQPNLARDFGTLVAESQSLAEIVDKVIPPGERG